MAGSLPPINDEDLQSFVDGELDAARTQTILSRLAASPADAARADAWRRQNAALRAAFAEGPTEPPQASLGPRPRRAQAEAVPPFCGSAVSEMSRGSSRRNRVLAAGVVLGFAAGAATSLVAGLLAGNLDVRKHLRFDRDPRASLTRGTDDPFIDRTLRGVVPFDPGPARLGRDTAQAADLLIVPNLADAGLRLSGLRAGPGSPSCLLYVTATDVEVTLCIDTAQAETAMPARNGGARAGPAISWRQNGARYSLAGALTDTDLGLLADRTRAEIDKFVAR
jgi:hypothetical protein